MLWACKLTFYFIKISCKGRVLRTLWNSKWGLTEMGNTLQIFFISKLMQNWRHFSEAFHWSQILTLWRVLKRVLVCPPYLIVYHILSDFFNESLWLTAPLCLIFYFIHVCMMSKIWSSCLHPVEISFGNMSILNGWNVWRIIFLFIYFTYSVAFVEKSFICNHLIKISGGDLRLEGFYSTSIKLLNFVKMNPHISRIFPFFNTIFLHHFEAMSAINLHVSG